MMQIMLHDTSRLLRKKKKVLSYQTHFLNMSQKEMTQQDHFYSNT